MASRWTIWLATSALIACGEDVSTDVGADQADVLAAADLRITNGLDDSGVVDAGMVDSGVVDVVADLAPADATPAGLPTWLTGTWLECSGDLTIVASDHAVWHAAGNACTVTAQLAWHDGELDFNDILTSECPDGAPLWFLTGTHASSDGEQLTLVHPKLFAGLKRFRSQSVRERWALTASTGGKGILRLCFDGSGQFYDGNWVSSDCSVISCGAIVTQVKHVGTETHVWTECQGGCPCTDILIASQKTEVAMTGKYAGGNCLTAEDGTFTAVALPFAPTP